MACWATIHNGEVLSQYTEIPPSWLYSKLNSYLRFSLKILVIRQDFDRIPVFEKTFPRLKDTVT